MPVTFDLNLSPLEWHSISDFDLIFSTNFYKQSKAKTKTNKKYLERRIPKITITITTTTDNKDKDKICNH